MADTRTSGGSGCAWKPGNLLAPECARPRGGSRLLSGREQWTCPLAGILEPEKGLSSPGSAKRPITFPQPGPGKELAPPPARPRGRGACPRETINEVLLNQLHQMQYLSGFALQGFGVCCKRGCPICLTGSAKRRRRQGPAGGVQGDMKQGLLDEALECPGFRGVTKDKRAKAKASLGGRRPASQTADGKPRHIQDPDTSKTNSAQHREKAGSRAGPEVRASRGSSRSS